MLERAVFHAFEISNRWGLGVLPMALALALPIVMIVCLDRLVARKR